MQFDQAGDQVIAADVEPALRRPALAMSPMRPPPPPASDVLHAVRQERGWRSRSPSRSWSSHLACIPSPLRGGVGGGGGSEGTCRASSVTTPPSVPPREGREEASHHAARAVLNRVTSTIRPPMASRIPHRGRCRGWPRPPPGARRSAPPPRRGSRRRGRRWARRAGGSGGGRSGPRAMFTRCCLPPEKVAGGRLHSRSGRLSRASRSPARARAGASDSPPSRPAASTTSRADPVGSHRRNCET